MTRRLRVLLVEDDPSHVVLIRRALEGAPQGLDLEVVDSVARARQALSVGLPDILVTDHKLPDGRGLELVGEGELQSRCPVVLLTGHGDETLAVQAMKSGAVDYVPKSAESICGILPTIERAVREWRYRLANERAQREIRTLKGRLEAIFDAATGLAMFATDDRGIVTTVSGGAARMLGCAAEEISGQHIARALRARAGDDRSAVPPHEVGFSRYVQAVREAEGRRDWRCETRSGAPIDVELRVRELNGDEYVFVALDVTARHRHEEEQRKLEQRTARSQKMESLGLFAGGIAHDFNNLLSCILGYSGLGADVAKTAEDPELEEFFCEIETAGVRGRDLVAQILAFSRGDVLTPAFSSLRAGLRSVERFLGAVLPSAIRCTISAGQDDLQVAVSETQLHQLVVNLALNARDAMKGSGDLTITSQTCDVPRTPVLTCESCQSEFSGEFAEICIGNSGPDIEPRVFDKMFDPFFSGRPIGEQGTGMGLSVVHGILHRAGGHICVSPRNFVQFCMYIPLGPSVAGATENVPPAVQRESGRCARIVVVDDEPSVARMLGRVLRGRGYEVREHTSSDEALAEIVSDPHGLDLLLTDLIMPGLRGTDLARSVAERRPDLPIILCSGYGHDIEVERLQDHGVSAFLPKPVDLRELCDRVAQLLRAARTQGALEL